MPSDRPLLQQRGGGDSEEHLLGVDSDTQKYIPVSVSLSLDTACFVCICSYVVHTRS